MLVVDDHVDAAETMGMLLGALGVAHRLAFDGQQAIGSVAAFAPHAVFLDLGMPDMDGFEVAHQIRSRPNTGDTVLIALTGWSQ
ncbi:MAG TPA: response regulator, partial [Burkholderiaceae bacterium]|nr:response regulator [Burkholderiaceae bacterium]